MILITGTPRTGSTFLVQLYHEMGFDTGFSDERHAFHLEENHRTHGGLEYAVNPKHHTSTVDELEIIKHPWGLDQKAPWRYTMINAIEFDHVIITNRDYDESLASTKRHFSATHYYRKPFTDGPERRKHYVDANIHLREHYPDHIEVDFPRSAVSRTYLYRQLKPSLEDRVSQSEFNAAFKTIARPEYVTSSSRTAFEDRL